jgi:hypothetical protein
MKRPLILAAIGMAAWGGVVARAEAAISVAVDPALDRRAVSPWIFGINFGTASEFADLPYPMRRWGNGTTRYSWNLDAQRR